MGKQRSVMFKIPLTRVYVALAIAASGSWSITGKDEAESTLYACFKKRSKPGVRENIWSVIVGPFAVDVARSLPFTEEEYEEYAAERDKELATKQDDL